MPSDKKTGDCADANRVLEEEAEGERSVPDDDSNSETPSQEDRFHEFFPDFACI